MKKIYPILAAVMLAACAEKGYVPKEGDLLFQVAGQSDFSEAISNATAWADSLKFVHVAIVAVEDGKPYVIEASDSRGCSRTEWEDFLQSSGTIGGKPGVVVKRIAGRFPADAAVRRAKEHIGEAYDWSYRPDNGKVYCSELVYECYLKDDGTPLFAAQPMNFRDADGNMPAFWEELFGKLGEPVPEGVPGTNPNDLSKDTALVEVYRFF